MLPGEKTMRFQAPCCSSVRECRFRAHYIIDVKKAEILRKIEATRCYRGIVEYYVLEPTPDIIVVEHYVSNRGVNYIHILYKPQTLTEDDVLKIARRALGLEIEEKIILK
jgi:hypothetical protein